MSMNVTRSDFVLDYVVARPRPQAVPGRLMMGALIILMLLALAATFVGSAPGDAPDAAAADVLMQGP